MESRLKIMGVAAEGWVFEESVLDEQVGGDMWEEFITSIKSYFVGGACDW